jgi:hypothetical protein
LCYKFTLFEVAPFALKWWRRLAEIITYGKQNLPFVIALNCTSPYHFTYNDLELLVGKDLQFTSSNKPMSLMDKEHLDKGIFSNHFMDQVAALFITWVTPYHQDDEQWYWCENPNFSDKNFQKSLINQIL